MDVEQSLRFLWIQDNGNTTSKNCDSVTLSPWTCQAGLIRKGPNAKLCTFPGGKRSRSRATRLVQL